MTQMTLMTLNLRYGYKPKRDIPKIASQASSASLSLRKTWPGVWGTPQKRACGYPHAMLAKHIYSQDDVK